MTVFGAYSNYYDLLYEDKNYAKEVEFVSGIIRRYSPDAKTILDLGCGTGIHALGFAQKGYQVTGIDRSAEMLAKAAERCGRKVISGAGTVGLQQADIRELSLSQPFDVIVALFHVICYLPINEDLDAAFARIRQHLKPGGLLIFDQWYGPGVLTELPAPRVKTFENDDAKIIRAAKPELLVNDNLVDVRYDLTIIEKRAGVCREVVEKHRVRYLFWPEIQALLARYGLKPVAFGEWLTGRTPDRSSWNTYVAAMARPETA